MIEINGNNLTLSDILEVARFNQAVRISTEAVEGVERSHQWVESIECSDLPVYGINTGFGIFSNQTIPLADSATLSRNLILSHAVATGPELPQEVVRAAMLVRANALAKGYSGVRIELVQKLVEMLNKGITPVVPSQGSLGSSGDLGPLSHMALVFTTDRTDLDSESGWADYQGKRVSGKAAMSEAGLTRIVLGPKEGLALNNGATFSAALAALAVSDAIMLLKTAEISLAMSLEAMLSPSGAFDPRLHEARGHKGQIVTAEHVRQLISGSTFIDRGGRVQDAYSLRCAPQVHGAIYDTVTFVKGIIEREINAATDNPLLFEPCLALSGGNFHGEPIGLAMDYLGIAMAELGAISERRTFRLTDGNSNAGLPPMLVDEPAAAGLNSGLMMPQYTAASLVLENETLATPDSVHSLTTSGGQEDHNANSMTAARHAHQIIANTMHVLAIELYTSARAVDLRKREFPDGCLGTWVEKVHQRLRQEIPYRGNDGWWGPEIEKVKGMIATGELASLVQYPEDEASV